MIHIAILGAGNIAGTMAKTLKEMTDIKRFAVGARELSRGEEFARKYGFQKAYGSYEELVCDKEVELVYIATPHSHHYEHIKLCLNHGKHVLCEKAFTVNEVEAREVIELAEQKKLLLAEAIWTRYMPMRKTLDDVIESGIIGKPYLLTANLGYIINHVPRMIDPNLAGGTLLDLGVYPLNFASMVFGDQISKITSTAILTDKGVDAQDSITLVYNDGKMAVLNASMMALSDRRGVIYGEKGFIEVENINNPEKITVFDTDRKLVAVYEQPKQISGYEYEVTACIKAIQRNQIECSQMPHSEIIRIMKLMDSLRKQWGVRYPMEI